MTKTGLAETLPEFPQEGDTDASEITEQQSHTSESLGNEDQSEAQYMAYSAELISLTNKILALQGDETDEGLIQKKRALAEAAIKRYRILKRKIANLCASIGVYKIGFFHSQKKVAQKMSRN